MPRKNPNLLFILTDEQRFDTMLAYGNKAILTPTLNKLSNHSTIYEKAYVAQPVCAPGRSTLYSGLYPHTNGVINNGVNLNSGIQLLPELISNDYTKGFIGRTGNLSTSDGKIAPMRGLDSTEYFNLPPEEVLKKQNIHPIDGSNYTNIDRVNLSENQSGPSYLAEQATKFIRKHQNEPFALFCSIYDPHSPYFGPLNHLHDPDNIPLRPNVLIPPESTKPLKNKMEAAYFEKHPLHGTEIPINGKPQFRRETMNDERKINHNTKEGYKKIIANYWGNCSLVDRSLEKIFNELQHCNLYDDTTIIFTSEHGAMLGSHSLMYKCFLYEESARVPLLIKYPNQKTKLRIKNPVSHIDVAPTILDLLNQPTPNNFQGKLLPLDDKQLSNVIVEWNGWNGGSGGNFVCSQDATKDPYPEYLAKLSSKDAGLESLLQKSRTIITPQGWKFTWSSIEENELYNLNTDPFELTNLAFNNSFANIIANCKKSILAWQENTNDLLKLP